MKEKTVGMQLFEKGSLAERIAQAETLYTACRCCPRRCGVNRLKGELGFCRTGADAAVASFNAHPWEEPPLSGTRGSGTIFFTQCTLRCMFCQNYPLSSLGVGRVCPPAGLADMLLNLQGRGCHNINFVTPTHAILSVLRALAIAYAQDFHLPIVWNCSGYESPEGLALLDGIVDIYLPDIKYRIPELAQFCSGAPDYQDHNDPALKEMLRQVGSLRLDEEGIACSGLIVRHMVLPGQLDNTRLCLDFVAREISPGVSLSLMGQYFPAHHAVGHSWLGRRLRRAEYRQAIAMLEEFGLENGWHQDVEDLPE